MSYKLVIIAFADGISAEAHYNHIRPHSDGDPVTVFAFDSAGECCEVISSAGETDDQIQHLHKLLTEAAAYIAETKGEGWAGLLRQ